jgi:ATP-grasp domain, R2K clade family 3
MFSPTPIGTKKDFVEGAKTDLPLREAPPACEHTKEGISMISTVILQSPTSYETRAIRTASMLMDGVKILSCSLEEIGHFSSVLKAGAIPVGSVEFVRLAMAFGEIKEPSNLSYPPAVVGYLGRRVQERRAGSVIGRCFVKPQRTKAFTGFVFDTMEDPKDLSPHDKEQHDAFIAMDADEMVWVSEPVNWVSEWRYYVMNGLVIGKARYDSDGEENAPQPEESVVMACINEMGLAHPYAIDFGVLDGGKTALVEVNDAWAIGLYKDAMSAKEYFSFLKSRWDCIRA